MKNLLFLVMMSGSFFSYAQVGINTTTPEATLDINGNLIIREVADASAPNTTYEFLVKNQTTNVVEKVTGNLGTVSSNSSIAQLSKASTTGILAAEIYSGYNRISFEAADVKIDRGANVNVTNHTYTIPSSGVYAINFDYRYGNGVELQLFSLNGNPRVAILKQNGPSYSVVDSRIFSGVNASLLGIGAVSVVISQANINSVYEFTAGDVLSFEVFLGGIALNVLGKAATSVSIYKISD